MMVTATATAMTAAIAAAAATASSSSRAAIRLATTAIAGTLALSSGRNMLQTWLICRQLPPSSSIQSTPSSGSSEGAHRQDSNCPDPTLEPFMLLPGSKREGPQEPDHNHDAILDGMERGEKRIERNEDASLSRPLRSAADIVRRLQAMDRRQLLQVYLNPACCAAPRRAVALASRSAVVTAVAGKDDDHDDDGAYPFTGLDGEWEGVLLDNYGAIMTGVAHFLTHRCFAWGRNAQWNGKSFFAASSDSSYRQLHLDAEADAGTSNEKYDRKQCNRGANRIVIRARGGSRSRREHRHRFGFALGPSRFPTARRQGQQASTGHHHSDPSFSENEATALVLDYSRYQPWYSPWKTMTDEIRVVRVSSHPSFLGAAAPGDGMGTVLLGWGCMRWSGGILNASPFCLYRTDSS